ncbi:MAG: hypothetical protein WC683_05125 [bacterium]
MICGSCGFPIEGEEHYEPAYERSFCDRCWKMPFLFFPSRKLGQQNLDGAFVGLVRKHPRIGMQHHAFALGKRVRKEARS